MLVGSRVFVFLFPSVLVLVLYFRILRFLLQSVDFLAPITVFSCFCSSLLLLPSFRLFICFELRFYRKHLLYLFKVWIRSLYTLPFLDPTCGITQSLLLLPRRQKLPPTALVVSSISQGRWTCVLGHKFKPSTK